MQLQEIHKSLVCGFRYPRFESSKVASNLKKKSTVCKAGESLKNSLKNQRLRIMKLHKKFTNWRLRSSELQKSKNQHFDNFKKKNYSKMNKLKPEKWL